MSTLQVANLHFESTGNNRIQLATTNTVSIVAAGSNTFIANNTNIRLNTSGTQRVEVVSNGTVVVGNTTGATIKLELLTVSSNHAFVNSYSGQGYDRSVKIVGPAHEYPGIRIEAYGGNTSTNLAPDMYGEIDILRRRADAGETYANTANNDYIGAIGFKGWNTTLNDYSGGFIYGLQSAAIASTGNPLSLEFWTNSGGNQYGNRRARINESGYVLVNSIYKDAGVGGTAETGYWGTVAISSLANTSSALVAFNSSATQTAPNITAVSARAQGTQYPFLECYSSSGSDRELVIFGTGAVTSDSAYASTGADYAEYFEWLDGNVSEEDRRGYSVVLVNNKIRKATANDQPSAIIGVISATPTVIGDTAWNKWAEKYLRDDFGTYLKENYEVWEWTEVKETVVKGKTDTETINHSYAFDSIPNDVIVPENKTVVIQQRRILNPDYDPTQEYIPRDQRPEWSPVGMMGKLRLRKGQPTGDRWIKMRDVSAAVEEWLVR